MANERPILVALPLDEQTADIVAIAAELGRRLAAPIVVLHAIPRRRLESERGIDLRIAEARHELEPHIASLRANGLVLQDVMIELGHPAEEVIEAAPRLCAQMIVTGGGQPATVRRWVVGSVAETIVRQASIPVWVARGVSPVGRTLLCPIDLTAESRVGLETAIDMAKRFQMSLSVITVLHDEGSNPHLAKDEGAIHAQLKALLATYDTQGLQVSMTVTAGDPAEEIVNAAEDAGLLVVATRGYDPLVRDWLGPVSSRALSHSTCSALTIRHLERGHHERERVISRLAELHERAKLLLADGRGAEALPMLAHVAEQAATNASVQETYARALEHAGRAVEATSRHELAALIRSRLD